MNNTVHDFRKIAGMEQERYGVRMKIVPPVSETLMNNAAFFVSMGKHGAPSIPNPFNTMKNFEATDAVQWQNLIANDIASKIAKESIFGISIPGAKK